MPITPDSEGGDRIPQVSWPTRPAFISQHWVWPRSHLNEGRRAIEGNSQHQSQASTCICTYMHVFLHMLSKAFSQMCENLHTHTHTWVKENKIKTTNPWNNNLRISILVSEMSIWLMKKNPLIIFILGHDGAHIWALEGTGRQLSEFEVSLLYKVPG